MKKSSIIIVLILFFAPFVGATNLSCKGAVSSLMADHNSCKDDNGKKQLAFKLQGTGYWICSGSDSASSLVLSAKIAEKELHVYFDNDGASQSCELQTHYLKPKYIITP